MYSLLLIFISLVAGLLGSILGLGGGVIVIPTLTLIFDVDIRYAIAASLISIIATSSSAAASFLKDHLTNIRLAVFLEVGTVFGALIGFFVAGKIPSQSLFFLFGGFLMFAAVMMLRKSQDLISTNNHPWSDVLKLDSSFPDRSGKLIAYKVENAPVGLFIMLVAGVLSALLGIGSGIFKVLAMDGLMKLPIKVSSATSNFMIGVTASASAGAYLLRGDVRYEIAVPVALGIIIGSWTGAKIMPKLPTAYIRKLFVLIMIIASIQMMMKGMNS